MDFSTDPDFFALLTESYARLLGKPLVPPGADADWLYAKAPFVVLAHSTADDPKFIYANKAAQACFGYSLDEFLRCPRASRRKHRNRPRARRFWKKSPATVSSPAIAASELPSRAGALSSRTESSGNLQTAPGYGTGRPRHSSPGATSESGAQPRSHSAAETGWA